MQDLKVHFC